MWSVIAILGVCLSYFLIFYGFQKKLFKILCASINEYLGNTIDYYIKYYLSQYVKNGFIEFEAPGERPDPNFWNGRTFRLSDNFNHDDDLEDL